MLNITLLYDLTYQNMDDIDQREYDASLSGVFYTPYQSYSSTLRDEFTKNCPDIKPSERIVINLYHYCKPFAIKLAEYVHIQGKYAYTNKEYKISSSMNSNMELIPFISVRIFIFYCFYLYNK